MSMWFGVLACASPDDVQQNIDLTPDETGFTADIDGPIIVHDAIESPQWVDDDVIIEALILDEEGSVLIGQLFFRRQTSPDFESTGMILAADAGDDMYRGKIATTSLGSAGMHYYFKAVDNSNNESVFPEAAPDEYFKFDLTE